MNALAIWLAATGDSGAHVLQERERNKLELLFTLLKRIVKLDRLGVPGLNGACDEVHLAVTPQSFRKLVKSYPIATADSGVRSRTRATSLIIEAEPESAKILFAKPGALDGARDLAGARVRTGLRVQLSLLARRRIIAS
jgi:hypothetical protein